MKYNANDNTVSDCWLQIDAAHGLRLVWDNGSTTDWDVILPDDVVEADDWSGETEVNPDDPHDPGAVALMTDWHLDTANVWDCYSATVKASAVRVCDPTDPDGPFAALAGSRAQNMQHDPNFRSGMEGASRKLRRKVAEDVCGVKREE